jgi:hypothetical protein
VFPTEVATAAKLSLRAAKLRTRWQTRARAPTCDLGDSALDGAHGKLGHVKRTTTLAITLCAVAISADAARADPPPPGRAAPARFSLHVATMFALGDAAGEADWATGLDLGFWQDRGAWVLEPRLGLRKDFDIDQDGGFEAYTLGVGAYALHRMDGVTLFGGGGASVGRFTERAYETIVTGSVLVVEHKHLHDDSAYALSGFARGGLTLVDPRGSRVLTVVTVELAASTATLNDRSYPLTAQLSLGWVL